MSQTCPSPEPLTLPAIPWDDVETLVKSGLAVRQIAEKLNMPDQFERIKRQVTRKGWVSDQSKLDAAIEHVQTAKATFCPNVPNVSQIMSQMGPDSKYKGAIALNNALAYFAGLSGADVAECADKFKAVVSTGTPLHGWGADKPAPGPLVTLHFNALPIVPVAEQLGPVVDEPVKPITG